MAVSIIITIIIIIIIYIIIIYIIIIYMYYKLATIKKKEMQFAPPLCFSIFFNIFIFFFLKLFGGSVRGSCINNIIQ